ncbi:MAG: hypothetical protein PHX51_08330 [Clostridia bacterium]|nr:hypothetical protein [Clostridia bacterium]
MRELLGQKEFELIDQNKCRYRIGVKGEVVMTLPTGVKRQIGQLVVEDGKLTYICFRKKAIHLMRVNNSYGVNEFILNKFTPDEVFFNIEDTGERLWIDGKELIAKSSYLYFKNSGFELQKFLPINFLKAIEV